MGKKFPRSLWGYRPSAVDEHLGSIARDAEEKARQLREETERALEANRGLKEQVEIVQKEIEGYKEKERAVAQAIIAAQLRASSIEEEARKVVEEQKQRVIAEIAAKRVEMNRVRAELERFRQAFSQMLAAIDESLKSAPPVDIGDVEVSLEKDSVADRTGGFS
ncbi:MAG: DivIVA domain-containing protein [Ignavibacteriales bacterium]